MTITCVGLVLLKPNGSVLAQLRDNNPKIFNPNTWAVCGGGRDEDDISLEAAAVRELFEETGYIADPTKLHFFANDQSLIKDDIEIHKYYFWTMYDGLQAIECREGQEIRFIHPSEIDTLIFAEGHQQLLSEVSGYMTKSHLERRN